MISIPSLEHILIGIMAIWFIFGLGLPDCIAVAIDSMAGKIVLLLGALYMCMHSSPIIAGVTIFIFLVLIHRASVATGADALLMFSPSEQKKSGHLSAFNQFPYTLEEEMVAKMAPIVHHGITLPPPSFKPMLDNLHDASNAL